MFRHCLSRHTRDTSIALELNLCLVLLPFGCNFKFNLGDNGSSITVCFCFVTKKLIVTLC
jgi:hypothetical protein